MHIFALVFHRILDFKAGLHFYAGPFLFPPLPTSNCITLPHTIWQKPVLTCSSGHFYFFSKNTWKTQSDAITFAINQMVKLNG